jgi:hypothetical protein
LRSVGHDRRTAGRQVFVGSKVQMVSSLINAKGVVRTNEFTRTNQFLFLVILGSAQIHPETGHDSSGKVR